MTSGSKDCDTFQAAVDHLFALGMPRPQARGQVSGSHSAGARGVYIPWRDGHITIVARPLRVDVFQYVISWSIP
jgi:hypothetical protein